MVNFLKKYFLYIVAILLYAIYFMFYSEKIEDENSPMIIFFIIWILMIISLIWRFYEFVKKQKL